MKNPNEYTDEEIYEMLISKMAKADICSPGGQRWNVKQAIALAYKSGYLRAQKGRSFIIGEKKEENKEKTNFEYRDGALVRFVGEKTEDWYPDTGTIGKVIHEDLIDWGENSNTRFDQDGKHCWYCGRKNLEVIG